MTFIKTRYFNQIWTRNTLRTEVRGLSRVKEDNRLENKEVSSYNLDDRIRTCDHPNKGAIQFHCRFLAVVKLYVNIKFQLCTIIDIV